MFFIQNKQNRSFKIFLFCFLIIKNLSAHTSINRVDCSFGEIVKRDTSKHRFINKITIYAGVINYFGISDITGRYNSVPGSFYISLTSNKRNTALKLGKAQSTKLNPNERDHFAAGGLSYLAFSKCFYFKKINYNIGVAGNYSSMYYYPNSEVNYIGGGIIIDFSVDITKIFSVNGLYLNSLYSRHGFKVDNYFSFGIGINLRRR